MPQMGNTLAHQRVQRGGVVVILLSQWGMLFCTHCHCHCVTCVRTVCECILSSVHVRLHARTYICKSVCIRTYTHTVCTTVHTVCVYSVNEADVLGTESALDPPPMACHVFNGNCVPY